MGIKTMVLLVLVWGHVCLAIANATNRKMMREDYTDTVAVSAVAAAAPDEEEMKNHHFIPRRAWDSSQDQEGAPEAANRA